MGYSECSVLESEFGLSWSSVNRLQILLKADDESLGVCFILCSSSPLATLQDHPEHVLEVGDSCPEQGSPPSDAGLHFRTLRPMEPRHPPLSPKEAAFPRHFANQP